MGLCLIVNSRNQQEKKGEIYHFPLILRLRRQPTRRLGVQYGELGPGLIGCGQRHGVFAPTSQSVHLSMCTSLPQ